MKRKKIINLLALLLALVLLNSGLNKFFNYMPMPKELPEAVIKDGAAMIEIAWLMPLLACAEILGALLLVFPKTRALGLLVVFPVLVGVLLTHIFVAPNGLAMALTIWAILICLIIDEKDKYLPLIR